MTTTLRLNDELKRDCDGVLEDIGLTFNAAVTIFMREVVRTGAIPFTLRSSRFLPQGHRRQGFMDAVEKIRQHSISHHDHEWTMDEIDAEIAAARKERRERLGRKAAEVDA